MPERYKLYLIGLKSGADAYLIERYFEEKLHIYDEIARKNILYSTPYVLFETEKLEDATSAAFQLENLGAHVEIKRMPAANLRIPSPGLSAASVKLQTQEQKRPVGTIFFMIVIATMLGGFLLFKTFFPSSPEKKIVVKKTHVEAADSDEAPETVRLDAPEGIADFEKTISLNAELKEVLALVADNRLQEAWEKITGIVDANSEDENALKLLKYVARIQANEDFEKGEYKDAIGHIEAALRYDDDDPDLPAQIGGYYYSAKDYDNAENYLQKALDYGAVNADIHLLLAFIFYYHSSDIDRAIAHCEAGLEMDPDHRLLQDFLERLKKEQKVEGKFQSSDSEHFIVKYSGAEDAGAAYTVLKVLENAWSDIGYDLGDYPSDPIVVLLYTEKEFNSATQAPLWAAAIYDGRIKLPVAGLPEKTDQSLRRILYHEYTHVVVQRITNGNCPIWLNEGLAQHMQERSGSETDPWLNPENIARGGSAIPSLKAYSAPFVNLNAAQALRAYTLSYYAVQYMIDEYGITDISAVLEELGTGKSFERALFDATNTRYDDFEKRFSRYAAER